MSGTFDSVAFVRIDWCSCRVNQLPCDYFPSGCRTRKAVSYYLLKSYIFWCWNFICYTNNEMYGFKMKTSRSMEFKWKHFNFYFKKSQNKQDTHWNTLPVMCHDAIVVVMAVPPHYDVILSFTRDLVHFRLGFSLQFIYTNITNMTTWRNALNSHFLRNIERGQNVLQKKRRTLKIE